MKKTCSKCNQLKDTVEFQKKSESKDGLQTWCRSCKTEWDRQYYHKSKSRRKNLKERKQNQIEENRNIVKQILLNSTCVDCGESDPIVLEFNHIDEKNYNISRLVSLGYSKETLLKEIKLCEILCANCHLKKTVRDFGYKTKKFLF